MITAGNLAVHEVTNPKELHDIWPNIRTGINAMRSKCPDMIEMPEDTYHSIKTGKMQLLIGTVDGRYEGFFVVGDTEAPDGKVLLISLIYNAGNDKEFLTNFFACIRQLTLLANYRRTIFAITRPGWVRLLKRMGWGASSTIVYHTIEV